MQMNYQARLITWTFQANPTEVKVDRSIRGNSRANDGGGDASNGAALGEDGHVVDVREHCNCGLLSANS